MGRTVLNANRDYISLVAVQENLCQTIDYYISRAAITIAEIGLVARAYIDGWYSFLLSILSILSCVSPVEATVKGYLQ